MDYTFGNRIRVETPTAGTGPLTLGAPLIDMQAFRGNVPTGSLVAYTIEDGPLAWEVGSGIYTQGTSTVPDTLTRDTVESSTNGNALVSLSGNANVYCTPVASWFNNLQEKAGTVLVSDTPPVDAHVSALWWDSAGTGLYVNYFDGNSTQWVLSENQSNIAGVFVGDAPPANAVENSLWWDSAGTGLYVRYNDGTSTQWVITENQNVLTDAPSDANTYGRSAGAWVNLASGAGALPFLPLSGAQPMTGPLTLAANATQPLHAVPLQQAMTTAGGIVTGPIMITATGGTVPRSAQDRAADVINVKDFGAAGDGTTDDTAAIQAAANAVPAMGAELCFPKGNYLISAGIALLSNTYVSGPGATITAAPAATWVAGGATNMTAFRSNAAVPTNITIDGLNFVWPQGHVNYGSLGAAHIIVFGGGSQLQVLNCSSIGGSDLVAFVGCTTTLIEGCTAVNASNVPYDHWGGSTDCHVVNNWCSTLATETNPGVACITWTGINTDQSAAFTTGFVCTGNICYMNATNAGACMNVNGHSGSGGASGKFIIANNKFFVPTTNRAWGILCTGMAQNGTIHHNYFEGNNGSYSAIGAFAPGSNIRIEHNTAVNWNAGAPGVFQNSTPGGTLIDNEAYGCTSPLIGAIDPTTMIVGNDTGTGVYAVGGGMLSLTNGTANLLNFGAIGVAPPAFTTRSVGTKIILRQILSGTMTDYAIGTDAQKIWHSLPQNSGTYTFQWYGGTTQIATLDGTGILSVNTSLHVGANKVVGGQIAGWGTSSGGSRGAVAGGSATLPQVAAALAQLLTDLQTHGLIGT